MGEIQRYNPSFSEGLSKADDGIVILFSDYKEKTFEYFAEVRSLQSQLDAAMHKETAMLLELERERKEVVYLEGLVEEERGRLDWWIEKDAMTLEDGTDIMWHDGVEWQTVLIIDGDIRAAINEAMKGGE